VSKSLVAYLLEWCVPLAPGVEYSIESQGSLYPDILASILRRLGLASNHRFYITVCVRLVPLLGQLKGEEGIAIIYGELTCLDELRALTLIRWAPRLQASHQ
jgi:hypothetical protein